MGVLLPYFTICILRFSDFIIKWGSYLLISTFIALFFLIQCYQKNDNLKNRIQTFLFNIPFLGKLFNKTEHARFLRTFATTYESGIPVIESLTAIKKITASLFYKKGIQQIQDGLMLGYPLYQAMQKTHRFPTMIIQMISIAEGSGTLDKMLNLLALSTEKELELLMNRLTTLFEPIIMVILGVVVGGLVIALYLPIFEIGSVI